MTKKHNHKKELGFVNLIREVIFGVEDSLVSTTGVLTGIAGAQADPKTIILSGMVVIVVEALSMGAGSYLSTNSEQRLMQKLINKERKEIKENPDMERAELVEMYKVRGFKDNEIEIIVNRIMQDEELILETMVQKEMGLAYPNTKNSKVGGVTMFVSYFVAGFIPLLPYFFMEGANAIITSLILGVVSLFILGYISGKITNYSKLRSAFEMALVAIGAAGLGYIFGQLVEYFY